MPVTFKDKGLKALTAQLKAMGEFALTIGYQGQGGAHMYPTGVNVATVALMNEFGTRDIPARSWLRQTLVVDQAQIEDAIAKAFGRVFAGTATALAAFAEVGAFITKRMKLRIDLSLKWAKPNKPGTVRQKGFNYPLHDTDRLARSLSWAVHQGGPTGTILLQGTASG
jgi:hypothetical protein